MKKEGETNLACGHTQVVSSFRLRLAAEAIEQHPVWCVECKTWVDIRPDLQ